MFDHRIATAAFAALLALCGVARSEVKLHRLFNDDMILQRASDTTLFGTADAGERVTVTAAGQTASAVAGADGRWVVRIDLTNAPTSPFEVVVQGTNRRVLRNVLAGEVYLCSGQSNMQMTLSQTENGKAEAATGDYPQIRQFDVPQTISDVPLKDLPGWGWATCTPKTAGGFYAVPYYFAKRLHADLGVPVGLVCSKMGGTIISGWTRSEVLERDPALAPALARYAAAVKAYPEAKPGYDAALADWEKNGKKGPAPVAPVGPGHRYMPGGLYNGMIAPLIPLRVRGVIWYQGEQNVWIGEGGAPEYRHHLPDLITDWRQQWGQADLPFLIVQLPNFGPRKPEPGPSAWAELREAQLAALKLPNTAYAVTVDVGDANDVHPKNKKDVGERVALAALASVYGKPVESHGPEFASMTVTGDAVTVRFDHATGLTCKSGAAPTGFAVAGADHHYHWAEATLGQGGTVVLRSAAVPAPVAVRYAWADTPDVNLVNATGLPATPFRTDDWPQ